MSLPRISIVTPTLNRAEFLGEAIESVLAQNYANLEHIIVDGMSTDGTVALLARYPHLTVIREPDTGLYEALNKGLRNVSGEIVGHLNSDDLYLPGAFHAVAAAFQDEQIDTVCGGVEVFEENTKGERQIIWNYTSKAELALSFHNLTLGAPLTNARFFRRNVYASVGYTDDSFRIAADREFLLRVALTNPAEKTIPHPLYRYRVHPGALTFTRNEAHRRHERTEYITIAERLLQHPELSADAREALKRWYQHYTVEETLSSLLQMRWLAALRCAVNSWRRSGAGWFRALFTEGWRGLFVRLRPAATKPGEGPRALEL